MGFEDFEPIFGEVKAEYPTDDSVQLNPYLFHVYATDPSRLKFCVTDFRAHTWEADRSIQQLEDMRVDIGIGGSWSEFMDYVISSLTSDNVKLVLEGNPKSMGATSAKLVAQKSKGMPRISISLSKLVDSAAGDAMANLSLELFKSLRDMQKSLVKEQERSCQLTRVFSAEQEKSQILKSQLDAILYSKKPKLHKTPLDKVKMFTFANSDTSPVTSGLKSTDEHLAAEVQSNKVTKHVVPAHRRSKVRGAILLDTEEDERK
ncbi:hypothetical protein Ancab_002926 [Ancistrocladus abbreviatus]